MEDLLYLNLGSVIVNCPLGNIGTPFPDLKMMEALASGRRLPPELLVWLLKLIVGSISKPRHHFSIGAQAAVPHRGSLHREINGSSPRVCTSSPLLISLFFLDDGGS